MRASAAGGREKARHDTSLDLEQNRGLRACLLGDKRRHGGGITANALRYTSTTMNKESATWDGGAERDPERATWATPSQAGRQGRAGAARRGCQNIGPNLRVHMLVLHPRRHGTGPVRRRGAKARRLAGRGGVRRGDRTGRGRDCADARGWGCAADRK